MSGARASAIDVMTPEDTALLDSMRNETDAPEVEVGNEGDADLDAGGEADLDEAPAAEAPEDPAQHQKQHSRAVKRIHELAEKVRKAEEARIAAEQKAAVSEGVVAERLRLLTEAAQSALQQSAPPPMPVPEIEIPDIDKDPVGHFKAQLELVQRKNEATEAILKGFTEQQQVARAKADLRAWGAQQEAAFAQAEPAYVEAMNFMLEQRRTQLKALGIVNPVDQNQIIGNDIEQMAIKTRSEGVNFAERMWNLAGAFGYQKKAHEPEKPVVPPLEAGLPAAADRNGRAETGRANATTIGTVGASPPIALTPERIANMNDAQFAKYLDVIKSDPSKLRDLMGH